MLMIQNEDKEAWCRLGETQEIDFVANRKFRGTALKINPKKKTDKYSHDFRLNVGGDLKTITTEWVYSERMFGIPHPYAISINEKDLTRYMNLYPNILLILDIQFETIQVVKWVDVKRLAKLAEKGIAKRHEYKSRVDDKKGNAKVSYVYDMRWFSDFTPVVSSYGLQA